MSEKRFFTTLANDEYTLIQKKGNPRSTYLKYSEVVDLLNKLYEENEELRMKLKGDDYIMVSEMLSNLRKTGICDGCKNKNKPVEWYLERGFSITERVCDRYEPE